MEQFIIPAQSGMGFEVPKGHRITVIDAEDGQVADFFAVMKNAKEEYISPAVTIDCNESLCIEVGTILYSNQYHPMFRVERDDVGKHDLLFPSCSKAMYDFFYQNGEGHPNCLDNLNKALGMNQTIIQPVNLFMNTVIEPTGKIRIEKPLSKAGDKIVLRALEDCIVAISACSVAECDANSGLSTPIAVCLGEDHHENP